MPVRSWFAVAAGALLVLAGGIALGTGLLDGDDTPAAASSSVTAEETPQDTAARVLAEGYREQLAATPLTDRLATRMIGVLALPGASDTEVTAATDAITSAGGTVVSSVRLTERLLDPADRQFASGVAEQALAEVADTPTEDLANYELVGAALGRAVTASQPAPVDGPAQNVLAAMVEAKLVETITAPTHRAAITVVVAGTDSDFTTGRDELLSTVLSRIDAAGIGTLVAGPVGSGAPDAAVAAVREGAAAESVSTVDVLDVPFGDLAMIGALLHEVGGTAGHYGTAGAADGAMPPLS